jgi:hypothetical protein
VLSVWADKEDPTLAARIAPAELTGGFLGQISY